MARMVINNEPEWLRQAGDPTQWMQFNNASVRFCKGMIRKDQVEIAKAEFGKIKRVIQVIGKDTIVIEGLQETLTN